MLLYRIISVLLLPFLTLLLLYRSFKGKEDKARLSERFGNASIIKPSAPIFWLHAVSVGESNSALTLVEEILRQFPQHFILFTTTTTTSATLISQKIASYNNRVLHQFLPIDSFFVVRKFLKYWQPQAALFIESEIWPNLIYQCHKFKIKSFLINARISDKSKAKWQLACKFNFRIFNYFSAIFAQTKDDQIKLSQLTNKTVLHHGNLKSQAKILGYNQSDFAILKSATINRPLWLAASTHKGEEQLIIETHKNLKQHFAHLLTIIVPRHPNRIDEIKNDIKTIIPNCIFRQRSLAQTIDDTCEIYLADTLGELGLFYRLSAISFIGGSLVKVGGHNPYEAIKLNSAIISGNEVFNFKEIYEDLTKNNAAFIINSQDELQATLQKLLIDENLLQSTQHNANSLLQCQNITSLILSDIKNKL